MRAAAKGLILTFLLSWGVLLTGYTSGVDSLKRVAMQAKSDSLRIDIWLQLAKTLMNEEGVNQQQEGRQYAQKCLVLSKERKLLRHQLKTLELLSDHHTYHNDYSLATKYLLERLDIANQLHDTLAITGCYHRMAVMNFYAGKVDAALANSRMYLKYAEPFGNKQLIANGYTMMSVLYINKNDSVDKAIPYFEKEIAMKKQIGDSVALSVSYNNYGSFLSETNRFTEAEFYLREANRLGLIKGDSLTIAYANYELGLVYMRTKRYALAVSHFKIPVGIWKRWKHWQHLPGGLQRLSQAYEALGDAPHAYTYLSEFIKVQSYVDSTRNMQAMNELEAKYEGDKKAKEIRILNQRDKLRQAEQRIYKMVLWGVSIGLLLVMIMSFFIYRGLRQKKQANAKLALSNAMLEEKNKEILDSIHYASRIQGAIMKEDKLIRNCPFEHFVIFKPRDIVSGDFYWSHNNGKRLILAVADCTGHGVPGAFLTVLGNSILNEIVNAQPEVQAGALLDQLRQRVVSELSQEAGFGTTKDGMDISLGIINLKPDAEGSYHLQWAGANNPLWVTSQNSQTLRETKPDKQPIGYADHAQPFTQHALQLRAGDRFYLFSDGFADQFGGEKAKKLKSANFRKLVQQFAKLSCKEQSKELEAFFDQWKGGLEQLDDVCVMGVQI